MIKDLVLNTHTLVASRVKNVVDFIDLEKINSICDVGSWNLSQSIEFLEIFSKANVYAFEENPLYFRDCENVYARLPEDFKKNLKIHNLSLKSEINKIDFYQVHDEETSCVKYMQQFLINDDSEKKKKSSTKVNVTTLDIWSQENNIDEIDFLWIDVRGSEIDFFEGARNKMSNVKCIFAEIGLKPYSEACLIKDQMDFYLKEEFEFVEISPKQIDKNSEPNAIYIKKQLL